jgi:hypothetical protein
VAVSVSVAVCAVGVRWGRTCCEAEAEDDDAWALHGGRGARRWDECVAVGAVSSGKAKALCLYTPSRMRRRHGWRGLCWARSVAVGRGLAWPPLLRIMDFVGTH